MRSLTIHHGTEKPFKAVGKHQCRLLEFAFCNQGWHTYATDRTTTRAIDGLERRGCIIVDRDLSMFKIAIEKRLTVHVYAENTLRAGRVCRDETLFNSGDVNKYQGTKVELIETAEALIQSAKKANSGGRALFMVRSANVIIDAVSEA